MTLHGQTTLYSNIVSDIRIAREAGYEALELSTPKLLRYLDAGLKPEELLTVFEEYSIKPACIDILADVERIDKEGHRKVLEEAEYLCSIACALGCPTIQLNAFNRLKGRPLKEIISLTAKNISEIADIGQRSGIHFQFEGCAWTPIHSISTYMQLIDKTDRDNVGVVIDIWHLWAGNETSPDQIAEIDRSLIYGVHIADGKKPRKGASWPAEQTLRDFMPGDGDIPLIEWVQAIKATGFDGFCAGEILGHTLWERDHREIAQDMRERMQRLISVEI